MVALLLVASLAQPQAGQKLLRVDLQRSPRGSNLVLEFAKPLRRDSLPVVPAGRRLVVHLPALVSRNLPGKRQALGAVRRVSIKRDRLVLTLSRLARPFADRAVVRVSGRVWRLKMSDPSVERDLADMLLGSERVVEKEPFNAFEESAKLVAKLPSSDEALSGSSEEQQIIAEEPAKAAVGLAAIAAATRGDGSDGEPKADDADGSTLVTPPIPPSGGLGRPVRIAAGFGLLALGIFGFLAWRRRQTPMEEAFGLKVVSRAKLDQKSSVAVLEVGGAVLIVGLSDQGPRLLARLDDGRVIDGNEDDEVDRLRALVGQNPSDRLGAWVNTAQSGREDEVSASPVVAPVAASISPNERADLQLRLAEIRRVCSD